MPSASAIKLAELDHLQFRLSFLTPWGRKEKEQYAKEAKQKRGDFGPPKLGLQNECLLNIAGILGFHVTLQGSKSQILLLKSNLNYYWFRQNVYSQGPILSEFSGL